MPDVATSNRLFRVDSFVVPQASLAEFKAIVGHTHEVLRRQDGFLRDEVLERVSGPGRFNVVTIVEWSDKRSYEEAVEAVKAFHAASGFDRDAVMKRLDLAADIGVYRDMPLV